ncbi:MAG: DoxX family protein [Salinivirgaceae bacterium]|jgi:uncharacterized membrane protein YphA (DoxX/SURF4 family)|nr:DoxX family protein [Salinivirgaceae bacterium]
MSTLQKRIALVCRILVGIVFIYSGFAKGVDPLGFTYKLNDYFTAFNAQWATSLSFSLSVILSLAEFVIGVAFLVNLKIKQASWGAMLFMMVFTPLTFVLALSNPVHDCGCFGDALILTNWQTFGKNIILLIPVVYIFIIRTKIENIVGCWEQWIGVGITTICMGSVIGYSYNHLPVLDFRPYKIGTHIPDKMNIPDGAPADEWESLFIYTKNEVEKKFDIQNLPDSTWTFVDAKHILKSKGYTPPIHDFSIRSEEGDEITDLVLASENYNFLLVAYNLEKYSYKNQEKIEDLANFCNSNGYNFYGLTASPNSDVRDYLESANAHFEFYNTDEITLKTIIRSNPGIVLIKSGTIIDKWHYNDIPNISQLENNITGDSISKYKKKSDNFYILLLIVSSGLMITLYLHFRKNVCK